MFDRLKNVMKGMLDKGVSKLETPEILAQMGETELENLLKQLKEATTEAITREKMIQKQLEKNQQELEQWMKRAAVAVSQDNDDVAKQCLTKKVELEQNGKSLQTQLDDAKASKDTLKERYADIEEKLREYRVKQKGLVARAKAGDAVANAQDLMSNASGKSMDAIEEKIRMKEARGEALTEMAGDDKFKNAEKQMDVDHELAALKAQMTADTPKLIVEEVDPTKKDE